MLGKDAKAQTLEKDLETVRVELKTIQETQVEQIFHLDRSIFHRKTKPIFRS